MLLVDDEAVGVTRRAAGGGHPAEMRMVWWQVTVRVVDHIGVASRPEPERRHQPGTDDARHREQGPADAGASEKAGRGVGQQPAGRAQRDLGAKTAGRPCACADRRSSRPDGVRTAE